MATTAHKLEYSPASEFCSFFHPPSSRGRVVSPLFDELANSSPWSLTIDTSFEDSESHDDGCTYSSTSTLCAALGLSTPNSPSTPTTPSSFKCFTPESPRYGFANGFGNGNRWYTEIYPAADEISETSVESIEVDHTSPTVFVWDLDETLIIFQTLLDGRYVELFDGFKDSHKATQLGRRWERLILEVCDDHFFYNHVEEYNYANVNSLEEYDDGADLSDIKFEDVLKPPMNADNLRNLRYLHRHASKLYEQGLENLLTPEQTTEWLDLYEATDLFTDGWLSAGLQKLEELRQVNEKAFQDKFPEMKTSDASVKSHNFIVTSGTLIPSLVKCLLFKLSPYFNAANIFSSREVGKLQCCRWIRDRFSQDEKIPQFCSIGDGPDEKEAARVLAWPFVAISTDPDAPGQLPLLTYKKIKANMEAVYKR